MTGTAKTRANKFAADCSTCSRRVPAGAGRLVNEDGAWLVFCADTTECEAASAAATAVRQAKLAQQADQCQVDLFCAGPCTTPAEHDAYRAAEKAAYAANPAPATRPRRRASSPRQGSTARRGAITRSRKACVTGGNCASHTGVNCGGYNCDAN